jgi:hypothetical protein
MLAIVIEAAIRSSVRPDRSDLGGVEGAAYK